MTKYLILLYLDCMPSFDFNLFYQVFITSFHLGKIKNLDLIPEILLFVCIANLDLGLAFISFKLKFYKN